MFQQQKPDSPWTPSKCSHIIVLRVYFASFLIHSSDGHKSLWFVPAPSLLNLRLFPFPLPQPALSALRGSCQQPPLPLPAPTSTARWTVTSPSCSSLVRKKAQTSEPNSHSFVVSGLASSFLCFWFLECGVHICPCYVG